MRLLSYLPALSLAAALAAGLGLPPRDSGRAVESSLTLLARGPAGLRIEGKSSAIALEAGAGQLVFSLPVASLDTGIALRDRHLRELLEADRFPIASLKVPLASVALPTADRPTEGVAQGELLLHGASRPALVDYRAERAADGRVRLRGTLLVDMRGYGIEPPTYLGMTVAPAVRVTAELSWQDG